MNEEQKKIRKTEMELFDNFTTKALIIVNDKDGTEGTITDACRLAEIALKAVRGEGMADGGTPVDTFGPDLNKVYKKAPKAKAPDAVETPKTQSESR